MMVQSPTQSMNEFISAAAQDLLKRPSATDGLSADDAEIEKKKKAAAAQTGADNSVIQGLPAAFNGAYTSLINKAGNQF